MERSKYLRNNGIMSAAAGFALMAFTATHQIMVPFMVVVAGLAIYAGIRDMIAANVLRDEAEAEYDRREWR